MKVILLTSLLFILSFDLIAQNKPAQAPTKNQQAKAARKPSAKPEIDVLAEKYKNADQITLFTSHGELSGLVDIEMNNDGKPQAVSIRGTAAHQKEAIVEFLCQAISIKVKKGYKSSDGNTLCQSPIYISDMLDDLEGLNLTFRKGSMYFVCRGGIYLENSHWFNIETGDLNRKGGSKAKNFDF